MSTFDNLPTLVDRTPASRRRDRLVVIVDLDELLGAPQILGPMTGAQAAIIWRRLNAEVDDLGCSDNYSIDVRQLGGHDADAIVAALRARWADDDIEHPDDT